MDFQLGSYSKNLHRLLSENFYIHQFGYEWGSNEPDSKVTHGWYECSTTAGFYGMGSTSIFEADGSTQSSRSWW